MASAEKIDRAEFRKKYGPWALIVGASHGLGEAFPRQLAALGLNCVLVARTAAKLESLKTGLENEFGVEVLALALDLSLPGATERMIAAIGEREMGLLVYNAGSPPYARQFLQGGIGDWSGLVMKNAQTLMECCFHFGGKMVERGRGGVVLVGSHAAFGGTKKLSVYTATKAFGANFGESLWAEWSDKGVDVINLLIANTDTPTLREHMAEHGMTVTPEMNIPTPEHIVSVGLAQLPNGPSFVFPDDENPEPGTVTRGQQRREYVVESTRTTAAFIGDD
ncbi:MAG: SDR family NAD(P)-dependent oxidoreductase [Porticoccaceae bacterium]